MDDKLAAIDEQVAKKKARLIYIEKKEAEFKEEKKKIKAYFAAAKTRKINEFGKQIAASLLDSDVPLTAATLQSLLQNVKDNAENIVNETSEAPDEPTPDAMAVPQANFEEVSEDDLTQAVEQNVAHDAGENEQQAQDASSLFTSIDDFG